MKTRSRIACISAAVAALMYGGASVRATDLTWDADPVTPAVQDGSGNWDTSTANWFDGTNNNAWVNSSPGDSAFFGNATNAVVNTASPNNIELAAPITVQNIVLGTAANGAIYNFSDFSGGSITLNGNITKATPGGALQFLLVSNPLTLAAGNHVVAMNDTPGDLAELSMNGEITGSGDLTVDNSPYQTWGTLALNVDNTYTGATNINNGRLVITTSGGLGSTAGGTTIGALGTLSFGGAGTTLVGGLNIAEPITITRNTYSGGEFGRYTAAIIVANTGTARTHTISGPFVVDSTDARVQVNTNTLVISSNITEGPTVTPGTGVLTVDGDFAGFVTLTGNNTGIGGGGIKIIGGVELNVSNQNNLGGPSAPITFAGSGTLHPVGGWMTTFGSHVINASTFSGGLDIDSGQTFTVDIPLGDANNAVGTIGKRGTGTLNLNSVINLRGGQTFWDSGTVNVNNSVTLASLHLRSPIVNIGTGGSVTLTSGSNSFGQDSTGTNGGPDIATVNLTGNGQLIENNTADFNISDNANTQGTINIQDSAVFTTGGITWLGKGTNAVGTINQSGGTVNINRSGNFALVLGDGRSSSNPTGHYNLSGTGVLNVAGEMYVGEGANGIGYFNMSGGTVNLNNWFVVGREGAVGTVDISGGTFNKTGGGNVSIGESGKNNVFTLRGNAQFLVNGEMWFANGGGHTATANIQDNAVLSVNNWFVVGRGGAQGTLDISGSASVTKSGSNNAYVGESTNAVTSTMTVRQNAIFNDTAGEFWVGQGGGIGILNIQDNGSFTVNNWLAVGRANGNSKGTINLSSGTLTKQGSNFLAIGSGGQGTFNQTGGTLNSNGTRLGEASSGTANLSGGTANFTGEFSLGYNNNLVGTLNISNTANVTVPGVVFGVNSNNATSGGVINLNGGTLTGASFTGGASTPALRNFKFNGGTLKPSADSTNFIGAKITGIVSTGGARIDTNNHAVTVNAAMTHDTSLGGADGGLTKSGAGTLTLAGNNTYNGPTSVTGGTLALGTSLTTSSSVSASNNALIQLPSNGTYQKVIKTGSVSVTGTAKIDLSDNKMIVSGGAAGSTWNGTSYSGVAGLVASGYNGGTQDGSGIMTSQSNAASPSVLTQLVTVSADDSGYAGGTFAGQPVASGDQLVMYTWGGDANLDGTLNGDDYFQIDSHFNQDGTIFGYFNGDFNYDGSINGDDYFIIDSNWNTGSTAAPFPTSAGAPALAGVTAVPEPASLGLLAIGACGLAARRRRAVA